MAAKKLPQNLNYRVLIEKEYYDDGTAVYNASCPTLGVFDYGPSIEKAIKSLREGMVGMVGTLCKQGFALPSDSSEESLVTYTTVDVPALCHTSPK